MNEEKWMCSLCFPNATEIGILLPGYSLILDKNEFSILSGQGHAGDILLSFKKKPIVGHLNPDLENLDISVIDPIWKEVDNFFHAAEEETENWKLSPEEGYNIIKKAIDSKLYDQEKDGYNFCYWLYNRCVVLIEEYEKLKKG